MKRLERKPPALTSGAPHAGRRRRRRAIMEWVREGDHVGPTGNAGELLDVEAIDRNGVVITGTGAIVRIIQVSPPNPVLMSEEERVATANTYCEMLSRLRPRQMVQVYIDARPIDLDSILLDARTEVAHFAGPFPGRGVTNGSVTPLALDRWRLYAAMEETLRDKAEAQAAMEVRAYLVVPYSPDETSVRAVLATLRPRRLEPTGAIERDRRTHQRALRQSYAMAETLRGDLDGLSLHTRYLNGEEVVRLLWSKFNPGAADSGREPTHVAEVLGELDSHADAEDARRAAVALRERIAESDIDFKRSKHIGEIQLDAVQSIYVDGMVDVTRMGWLLDAMTTRQPFTMSVYVKALDRHHERQKLRRSHRRTHGINRGAEQRGRPADFDNYALEAEQEQLLAQMTGHDGTTVYNVFVSMTLRAPGPTPDLEGLKEAVDHCADKIKGAVGCRVNRGPYQQQRLWVSGLPLGRNTAKHWFRYATENAGDTLPLVATRCGSPTGIPFAFTGGVGREVELFNPYDRDHANQTVLMAGQSGKGKTMAVNVIVLRSLAYGARVCVIDRAGHYETLTRLVHGARQIDIGSDDSEYAINPWDVEDPGNVSQEKIAYLLALHGLIMGDEGLNRLERPRLGDAIRTVYHTAAILNVKPRESMLRDELLARSDRERRSGGDASVATMLRNLADCLGEYCGEGAYAYLLDRDTNVPADSPMVVFDTRRCPDLVLQAVMFTIVEFIRATAAAHLAAAGDISRPGAPMMAGMTIAVLDEAWKLLGRKETGDYANEISRRARHWGLCLIVMSQGLQEFDTDWGHSLIRNATQVMLLALHPNEIEFVRKTLRLSEQEAWLIGRLKTVKGSHSEIFWMNGTRGRNVVVLRVGWLEYWMSTSDPLVDVPARDAAIAANGGNVWAAVRDLAARSRSPVSAV